MRKLKQDTVNQGVAGSSPASGAIFKGFASIFRNRLVQYLAVCPILLASATAQADTLKISRPGHVTIWQGRFISVEAYDQFANIRFGSYTNSELFTREPMAVPLSIESVSIFVDGQAFRNCQLTLIEILPGTEAKVKANCD